MDCQLQSLLMIFWIFDDLWIFPIPTVAVCCFHLFPFFNANSSEKLKSEIFFASRMLCESALEVLQNFRLPHRNLCGQNGSSQIKRDRVVNLLVLDPFPSRDFNFGLSLSQSQSALLILSIWRLHWCKFIFLPQLKLQHALPYLGFALRTQSQDYCKPLQRVAQLWHSQGRDWKGKKLHEVRASCFCPLSPKRPGAGHPNWRLSAGQKTMEDRDLMGLDGTPVSLFSGFIVVGWCLKQ